MREAEHNAARASAARAEADADERHREWVSEVERSHRDITSVLKSKLDAALPQTRALPNKPCQACHFCDALITSLQRGITELTANLADRAEEP